MAASASSRLLRFSNNSTLQNLIRHHLLRPTVGASQLLNKIPEPRFSGQRSSGYVAEILESKMKGYGYSLSIMGSSVVDHQSGILSIIQSGSDELCYDSSDDWTTPDEISERHHPEVDGIRRKNEKVEDYDDPDDEEDSDYDEDDSCDDDTCDDEDEIDE